MSDKRFKLILEYDGTDFFGWQRQSDRRTIQGEVEAALRKIIGKETVAYCASRTDAGVHAYGQVCHFSSETRLSTDQLFRAINANLPSDIIVRGAYEVSTDFHARFDVLERRYAYFVRTTPTALWRRYCHVMRFEPDMALMREAAAYFLGEKDFAGFTAGPQEGKWTVCRLTALDIHKKGSLISFYVNADHFLYRMVRIIVGTLLEVGRGSIPPEHIEEIFCKKDRKAAGPTLPPNGLFLEEVIYP